MIFLPICRTIIRVSTRPHPLFFRALSSSPYRSSSGRVTNLLEAVKKELSYEQDSVTEMHPSLKEYLDKSGYEIVENFLDVKMEKILKSSQEKVAVSFSILADVYEEDDDHGVAIIVDVVKQKNGENAEKLSFTADLSATDVEITDLEFEAPKQDSRAYKGPSFDDLDEKLQDQFAEYLGDKGIDTGLHDFITEYSSWKEQQEYVAWLKNVKSFLE